MIVTIGKTISFSSGTPSLTIEFSTKGLGADAFKSALSMSKKFLTGTLYQGDDKPTQKQIKGVDRFRIIGPFKAGKTGYDDKKETASLKISFELGSLEMNDLRDIGGDKFWFDIKEVTEENPVPSTHQNGS